MAHLGQAMLEAVEQQTPFQKIPEETCALGEDKLQDELQDSYERAFDEDRDAIF